MDDVAPGDGGTGLERRPSVEMDVTVPVDDGLGQERSMWSVVGVMQRAGLASIGAGVIHAGAGTSGVTRQQQAFAEDLVASTLVDLPPWADRAVAEAAGFRSIGDGATGHEHFIQWDWINDDVVLDPDHPESLVYEPQPDGSRTLVSAMYMLPDSYRLGAVPDWGGALMQWHIHDDLCFTAEPDAPRVGGFTNADGTCTAPLVKFGDVPMIHVWITRNECGPFAGLDGIGGGQVFAGEAQLCDTAHGSH